MRPMTLKNMADRVRSAAPAADEGGSLTPTAEDADPRTTLAPASSQGAVAFPRVVRPEHAAKLSALKRRAIGSLARIGATAFIGVGEVSDGIRMGVPVAGYAALGRPATFARSATTLDLERFDTLVFSRPHISPTAARDIDHARHRGKRVIVDLDDDFYALPPDHPGYHSVGPGNAARLQLLEQALAQADLLVVATPALAERYRPLTRRVAVIPNGWTRSNPLWEQAAEPHATLNIGWAGTPTHGADVALLVRDVVAFVRQTPQAQLIIGGDSGVWQMFADLPEARRTFVPMVPFDVYPNLLARFDVLLAPLCDNAFNRAKSDIKLLEAGIRRIPWVASPRLAYSGWAVGGLFADRPGEWHAALTRLAHDEGLRVRLGAAGRAQADQREAIQIAERWLAMLG